MKITLVQFSDAALVALATICAAAFAGWTTALVVLSVGAFLVWRASRPAPAETPEEQAEGRQRTYAQFKKDLEDPTGTAAVSIFRD